MALNPQWREFVEKAKLVYDQTLKSRLEPQHVGELIAVEPDSGEFVLATTINEMNQSTRLRFGTKPVHIFRVGGGAAVKIGVRHARVS